MSTPNGPPPVRARRTSPAVYRRRRIVALLVLLLVLGGIVWAVFAVTNRLTAGAKTSAAVPTTDVPTPTSDSTQPTPDPTQSTDAQPTECELADVDLELGVGLESPAAGQPVSFQLSVLNTADSPCLLPDRAGALVTTVTSGEDTVWSSAHCAEDDEPDLLLDAGAAHEMTVRWPGQRSTPGCADDQPDAGAGTYRVEVGVAGSTPKRSDGVVFTLG